MTSALFALMLSGLAAALVLSSAFAMTAAGALRAERARASRLLALVNDYRRKEEARRRREMLS